MNVLALDSATGACSVALWSDGAVLARRARVMDRGQAETLMPMVTAVVAEADLAFNAIDLFAVTVGPGAFTGLRVGLAAARGMALAADRPCFGVTTLEAVAAAVPMADRRGRIVLSAIGSKKREIYAQVFADEDSPITEPAAVAPEGLAALVTGRDTVVVGDAAAVARQALAEAGIAVRDVSVSGHPDPAVIAALAARRWHAGVAPPPPAPLYLRAPDATRPVAGGRLRP